MKTVGYLVLLLASLIALIGCEFEPLEPTAPTSPVTPVYYVFSLNGTVHTVCAVISGGRSMDLVLQPTAHTNGTFLVNGADSMSRFMSHFRNRNGDVTFVLRHIRRSCHPTSSIGSSSECDQLVITPNASAIDFRGVFKLQYIPEFTDAPVNLTFEYSPPAIFSDGNSTVLGQFGRNDSLTFKLRFTTSRTPSVCEIHANGSETTSTTFDSLIPKPDGSCITPSGSGSLITPSIQVVGLRDERNGVISPGLRRVFLTDGTCENNTVVSPVRSEPINVTVVLGGITTTTAPTTMESTSATPITKSPVETGFPMYAIIIIIVGVSVILLVVASCGVCAMCIWNKRKSRSMSLSNLNNNLEMPKIGDQDHEKSDGELNIKVEDGISHQNRRNNNYVPFAPVTDSAVTAESPTDTAVSGLIFITDGETQNYKDLEEKLLAQHCCKRIHPVAVPTDGSTPSWGQRWRGIASRLKNEKENCLVYVIWSGALETTNGNHNPPIRKVIQSLDRPLRKNTPSRDSVNHRLIFLQLGSKGTADRLITDHYIKVFWHASADDPSFDAEECGDHVCKVVCSVLIEHKRQLAVKIGESIKSTIEETDNAPNKSLEVAKNKDNPAMEKGTSDDKPLTEKQFKATVDNLIGAINVGNDKVIEHVSGVKQQMEIVAEKIDNQMILPEEEFEGNS